MGKKSEIGIILWDSNVVFFPISRLKDISKDFRTEEKSGWILGTISPTNSSGWNMTEIHQKIHPARLESATWKSVGKHVCLSGSVHSFWSFHFWRDIEDSTPGMLPLTVAVGHQGALLFLVRYRGIPTNLHLLLGDTWSGRIPNVYLQFY